MTVVGQIFDPEKKIDGLSDNLLIRIETNDRFKGADHTAELSLSSKTLNLFSTVVIMKDGA